MNRKQRKQRRRRASEHSQHKFDVKSYALWESMCIAKDGSKLKRQRTGEALRKAMEERGYVPNGKGGWRKLQALRSEASTLDKS